MERDDDVRVVIVLGTVRNTVKQYDSKDGGIDFAIKTRINNTVIFKISAGRSIVEVKYAPTLLMNYEGMHIIFLKSINLHILHYYYFDLKYKTQYKHY